VGSSLSFGVVVVDFCVYIWDDPFSSVLVYVTLVHFIIQNCM
jgi:hypothetical protein